MVIFYLLFCPLSNTAIEDALKPGIHCMHEQHVTAPLLNCCSMHACSVHTDSIVAAMLSAAITTVLSQIKADTSLIYFGYFPHRRAR